MRLEQHLKLREDRSAGAIYRRRSARKATEEEGEGEQTSFDLRAELSGMTGTDLTRIDEIDVRTAATVVSEAGWDMSKWRTEHHFVSWLHLCPDNRISGGKIIGKGRIPIGSRIQDGRQLLTSEQ